VLETTRVWGGRLCPRPWEAGELAVCGQPCSPEPQGDWPLPEAQWALFVEAEEPTEAQGLPDETDGKEEGGYESKAEEDYLSNLEATLAEPESKSLDHLEGTICSTRGTTGRGGSQMGRRSRIH
jgi:hypothetical protein